MKVFCKVGFQWLVGNVGKVVLSPLSPKNEWRAVREQHLSQILKNLNPSKLLLLFLSHVKDHTGHCCDMVGLKAIRMLFHKRGTEHPV